MTLSTEKISFFCCATLTRYIGCGFWQVIHSFIHSAVMGKTQCKSNSSEKQLLHATHKGKVEKNESGWCFLMKRATFMLEAQVEKITWKAFLLSEQNSQKDEYVQYLEEMLQESLKTATDFMHANSSHREECDTISLTVSVSCQTEETTYPVVPVKEEVNVEIPTLPTLPLTTNIEKGSNEDRNEVVATVCSWLLLQVERINYSQKTKNNLCRCVWCKQHKGETREDLYICFWCLSHGLIKRYSRHTESCKIRLAANDKCIVCDGFKITYSFVSSSYIIKCNLCKLSFPKGSWENHSVKCMRKHYQIHCTC